jgi:hypothetical protein
MRNVENVQNDLKILEHHHAPWAREIQQNDLQQLIEHMKQLEFNLSTVFLDCVSLGRQYWKDQNLPTIKSLHRSFDIMNSVFDKLKKIRIDLSEAYIKSSDLRKLVIDWGRFKKSIYQTKEYMRYYQQMKKSYGSSCLAKDGME